MSRFRFPNHFYESLLPIFVLSTVVGVFPMFPLRRVGQYTLYFSKKLHLITVLMLTAYSLSLATTIVRKSNTVVGKTFYKKPNKVSNFGITLEFFFVIMILYTIYLMSFVQTKHVRDVMTNLNRVDELLKSMKQKFRYSRFVCYEIVIISSGMVMIALITAMQSKNIKTENFPPLSVHMWILFTHPMIILYGMNSQFAITALLIYQRFKMISQQLERIKYKLVGQHVKTKASSKSLPILLVIKTKIFSCT